MLAVAAGEPIEEALSSLRLGADSDASRFERIVVPRLLEGARITQTFKALEEAWQSHARVRFVYGRRERIVEPYGAVIRSGRYFLLGREVAGPKDAWKYFALDQISKTVRRVGTFSPRPIPNAYSQLDVLGWIQGGKPVAVSVWLSPRIAPSATCRLWQRGQVALSNRDGSSTMTFAVSDIDEVIRWALGFAAEAKIVAPPEAVERARDVVAAIATSYAGFDRS
jgi:predicted DNA-binding transcriptional regulator YafY